MKKIILSKCLLLITTITLAQYTKKVDKLDKKSDKNFYVNNSNNSFSSSSVATPFFTNDFSDSNDWTIDPSSNGQDWVLGTNVPVGQYSAPMGAIASTSAANGYAMYDSDGIGSSGGTQDATITFNGYVDCSNNPYVNINFESYHRQFDEQIFVDISNDGVSWVQYQVDVNLPSNQTSANPNLVSIDISATAGGQPTVYFRFHYEGGWDYAWMVDDVSFTQTPDNLITTNNEVIGGFWIDYANYSPAGLNSIVGLDYTVTPLSQLANHPYVIEAYIKNEGVSEQHVVLNYNVTGASTYSGTSQMQILTNQQDSVFAASPSFSPNTIGTYSVEIWGEADSAGVGTTITNSDIVIKNIEVTNYIYGKDLGDSNPGSYILGGIEDQNHITTRYEMYANEQLYALRAFISDESDVGAEVKAIIYELDTTASSGVVFLAESDNYTIAPQDLGNWIDIPFISPISLISGFAYEFGIVGFNNPSLESHIGTAGTSLYNGEHSLFDEQGLSSQSAGVPTWYYITSTPMVRMNFDPSLIASVSNIENGIFNVYPNPSGGSFTISLDKDKQYDVRINNALGQTILSTVTNKMNTKIDLSSFDKGIYMVELQDENAIYTDKVIIE